MSPVRLDADTLLEYAHDLAGLLTDIVRGGASLGFLADLDRTAAAAWWRGLAPAVGEGQLAVWAARDAERITGTVSLAFTDKPNGRHRAEIAKLMVHPSARGKGLARALLSAAEEAAADAGVTLLVLDTETGSPAEALYEKAGWTRAGTIPDYATDPAGTLHPTTLFYKRFGKRLGETPPTSQ
ncbi:GNAT family N-acetyltransferase [Streptomyces sp. WAC 01529]|uniref:GNAT family N-acetyltransferase n=1 Tax=Streptomyces sp. WAC 01529 TaxID=2203205 RepID=UPI000F7177E7|nr:GNAT family N-acetyltransferase [Streptomyces sp. WAC 01529]AZM58074.1 GNAT family N-acetyltransferase [Streptomyces sp. WAC 01529]